MTEGTTVVNGQEATDGSVQVGKQTEKPDVPITEYQYAPVAETKDPDVVIILSDQDISDAELRVRQLSDIQRSISDNGVNYESVVALESIQPGIIMNNFPELGYTKELSKQSFQITMERIDGAKLGGVVAAILVIIASIVALFKKFTGKTDSAIEKVKDEKDFQELEKKTTETIPIIQEKAKLTEEIIKRNAEAERWLLENNIVDIIQLHGRLSSDINPEEVVKDLTKYLKQVGYGDPTRNVLFNINNIIGAHMPNVFYQDNFSIVLGNYASFLETFPPIVRKRLDSISSLNNAYAQVKYGKPFEYHRNESIIINGVKQFTGVANYNSEQEAIDDLRQRIKADWTVEDRSKDLTRLKLAKVISSDTKSKIINIINAKPALEKEFDNLEKFKNTDLKMTMNILQKTRAELEKLINASYTPEEKKASYRDGLRELDRAPGVYQEEFKIMGKLASAIMMPIINISSVVLTMHTRINMYYDLLDRLSSILKRFEAKFGEDL